MVRVHRLRNWAAIWGVLVVGSIACGEDGGSEDDGSVVRSTGAIVTVRFEYMAATQTSQAVLDNFDLRGCIGLVGRTHIHASWHNFDLFNMRPRGPNLWVFEFEDVPDGPNAIRVSDPNACAENDTGAVTRFSVFANDTLLTQRVSTPGTGIEPGFGFSVDADGIVYP